MTSESIATALFEGSGDTLDAAIEDAHRKMTLGSADFTQSEVVSWGATFGGFMNKLAYQVKLRQL